MAPKQTLEQLIKAQNSIYDQIQKTWASFQNKEILGTTESLLVTYIDIFNSQWARFESNHTMMCEMDKYEQSSYHSDDLYKKFQDLYIDYITSTKEKLKIVKASSLQPLTKTPQLSNASNMKLPRISLPTFDGDYTSWRSFYDLFHTLIHKDTELSKVEKLHYLKASVSGEAARLLKPYEITEQNYKPAWESLYKRYNNERVLINTQLKTLCSQQQLKTESASSIRSLIDQTQESLHELRSLKQQTDSWGAMLVYTIVQRLPPETKKLWEAKIGDHTDYPTYDELIKFLETRFRILEALQGESSNKSTSNSSHQRNAQSFHNNTISCIKCKGGHILFHCEKFRKLSVANRLEFVKQRKLCKNCLSNKHNLYNCPSKRTCSNCKRKHNTLLHDENFSQNSRPSLNQTSGQAQISADQEETEPKQSFFSQNLKNALLSTALVQANGPTGRTEVLRALIDSGSEISLISQDACRRLNLKPTKSNVRISGLGNKQTAVAQSQTKLIIKSLRSSFETKISVCVIPHISSVLPSSKIDSGKFNHIANLALADPSFYEPKAVDLLLGADVYGLIIEAGLIRGSDDMPVAQDTKLGWILLGPLSGTHSSPNVTTFFNQQSTSQEDINDTLKKFWEIEELRTQPRGSPEEQQCEECYQSSHTRHDDGHYSVLLPFRNPEGPELGFSRPSAIAQFLRQEKRFLKDESYYTQYKKCVKEYLDLGHMTEVPAEEIQPDGQIQHYYMPHHGVIKEDSTTTKLRVVFNASCNSSNGKNLNEQMLVGPTIQNTLWTTLLKWRMYKYAFTADIEKMYRMVHIKREHQNFQRIVWRESPKEPIKDYRLTTVTFGTAAAPFLAIRTLHQLALDEKEHYPAASHTLKTQCYVDDINSGGHSIEDTINLQKELTNLLHTGGFTLRKWTANHIELLNHIPLEHRELKESLDMSDTTTIKTLGIQWYPARDEFTFKVTLPTLKDSYSKRGILSEVARLFDPFGWLAPVIINGKTLMQKLWLSGCSWDEDVPTHLARTWISIREDLPRVETIEIPRWNKFTPGTQTIEIHGFADASNTAYAAVVYLKIKSDITLCAAKTRVAPVKKVSLPRLELCAAVLLAQLIQQIKVDLSLASIPTYVWTDSQITLAWIRGEPSRWKPFVANRVYEILEHTQPSEWRYVHTNDNPADCASRGVTAARLRTHPLWWQGPEWLKKDRTEWPQQPLQAETTQEIRKASTFINFVEPDWLSKYSSFSKLQRIVAYCNRFIQNCKNPEHRLNTRYPTISELIHAENLIIRLVQRSAFTREIAELETKRRVHHSSKLLTFNPFLDSEGLIRVGGRIETSKDLPYESKHPAIIAQKHHVTTLLIDHIHRLTIHGGTQLVLNTLRTKYWLLNARNTIRFQLNKCVTCFRHRPKISNQMMSNLPSCRVNTTLPFQHTGVDYAGPIDIKTSRIRNARCIKGYICLFICMATRAIHIEAVTDLTAEAFIAALRRFVSRRGRCTDLYSDCGTNFVKANKILINQMQQDAEGEGFKWHFNPPSAPHFGGLWEAGVKSTKTHLKKILNNTTLTFEELSTALCQIEACLNSRPIIPLSSDPNSHNLITPGHFITGRNIVAFPESTILTNEPALKRWQYIQALTQRFWRKWSNEYLHHLQQRYKWKTPQSDLQVDDIVLIKTESMPSTKWPLGKVIKIFHGDDKRVRVVQVKTNNSTLTRPIAKLCKLPSFHD